MNTMAWTNNNLPTSPLQTRKPSVLRRSHSEPLLGDNDGDDDNDSSDEELETESVGHNHNHNHHRRNQSMKRSLPKLSSSSSQRLKKGLKFVDGSSRRLLEVSGQRVIPLTDDQADHPDVVRLKSYVELHNEQSPHPISLFEVGYWQEPFQFHKEKSRKLCIGCQKCKHKIFPNEKQQPSNKEEEEEAWNLEEETRVLKDMEEHVTKHYMNTAKMILFLLEAIFRVMINYYDQ